LQVTKRGRNVCEDDNAVVAALGISLEAELSSQLARKKTSTMCMLSARAA